MTNEELKKLPERSYLYQQFGLPEDGDQSTRTFISLDESHHLINLPVYVGYLNNRQAKVNAEVNRDWLGHPAD